MAAAVLAALALACASPALVQGSEAEAAPESTAPADAIPEQPAAPQFTPGWVKAKNGCYYWRQADGTRLKEEGLHVFHGKKYYLNQYGYRSSKRWRLVDGKYYYFQKNGVMYEKKGWFRLKKQKYYLEKGGYRATGLKKISGQTFYFDPKGRLVKNKTAYPVKNRYYNINERGVAERVSTARVLCSQETRRFIQQHTNPSMTRDQKLRACYSYLLAYMHYRPKTFQAADFVGKDWPYNRALTVFRSPTLTGNCYGFACCVASCARELGFNPYVIVTTGDHGFVMIDGRYYDNMSALYASPTHPPYNILHKVQF